MPKAECEILKPNPQDGIAPIPNLISEAPAMAHRGGAEVETIKYFVKENSKSHQVIVDYHLCLFV
jgi:hypothetical protein